jgi:hypothetical protein
MGFSNVPGAKENWYLTGKRCKALGFSMPLGKTVPLSWGVLSHGDTLSIMVSADRAAVKDVDQLMTMFEKNLDGFLGSDWRKFDETRKKEK